MASSKKAVKTKLKAMAVPARRKEVTFGDAVEQITGQAVEGLDHDSMTFGELAEFWGAGLTADEKGLAVSLAKSMRSLGEQPHLAAQPSKNQIIPLAALIALGQSCVDFRKLFIANGGVR